jgi:hypothetical protein
LIGPGLTDTIGAQSAQFDNFHILLYRETGRDSETKAPTGYVLIDGGWLEGIEEGATGTIWRKNRITGRVDLATLKVVRLAAHETQCSFVLTHPDHVVSSRDRVEFEVVPRTAPDILAKAMAEFDNEKYCSAYMYFRGNDSLVAKNDFAKQVADQCRTQAQAQMTEALPEDERRRERVKLNDYLEIAQVYHERENNFMADYYVRRALAIDSSNSAAVKLRSQIPEVGF